MRATSPEEDELLRVLHREEAEQELVNQGKDGGIGADAKSQREDGNGDKNRGFLKSANGKA